MASKCALFLLSVQRFLLDRVCAPQVFDCDCKGEWKSPTLHFWAHRHNIVTVSKIAVEHLVAEETKKTTAEVSHPGSQQTTAVVS
jgi:hypothetical protein